MAIKNKKRVLSIVIKNEYIRICEVSKNSKSVRLHAAMIIPTPGGSVMDGQLNDGAAIAEAIKKALNAKKVGCKDIVFSIVSGRIATKEVVIPEVKDNRIDEIIKANSSEYFPVEVNDYIIRHTILERFEEEGVKKIRLQLVAAPKAIINSYYQLASQLDCRVEDIDYVGNSIAQLMNQQIGGKFCVTVNIESDQTIVSIFDNNVLKMQRMVPYGSSLIVDAVAEEYGVSKPEELGQKLYEEKVLQVAVESDGITESLSYLVNGIKRITDYYISRNGGRPFEKAYAVGDAATIPGFVTLVSDELGTDLIPLMQLENVTQDKTAQKLEKNITEYASSIGALVDPIGLVADKEADVKKGGVSTATIVLGFILAAVVSAALIILPLMDVWTYEDKIDTANKRIAQLSYVEEVIDRYNEAQSKCNEAMNFKLMTSNSNDSLHILIGELEKKMPTDIKLNGINVSSGSAEISGKAPNKSSIAKFIQQLRTIDTVKDIFLSEESEEMDNTGAISVNFSISFTFGHVTEDNSTEQESGQQGAADGAETGEQGGNAAGEQDENETDGQGETITQPPLE